MPIGLKDNGFANNQLLLQYLTGASNDLLQGQPIGKNVNAVTNQNITAQNYAKMLQQLLAGGSKINMTATGMKLDVPNTALSSPGSGDQTGTTQAGPGPGIPTYQPGTNEENRGLPGLGFDNAQGPPSAQPVTGPSGITPSNNSVMSQLLGGSNPSSSPLGNVTASDLAGLSPQDISSAISHGERKDVFEKSKVNDVYDNAYKLALIDQMQGSKQAKMEAAIRTAPLEVPGLGTLSFDTWKTLDAKTKAYSYYAFYTKNRIVQGLQPAGEEVLSYNEFINQSTPNTMEQYYKLAQEDPEFKKFYFESKSAGATQINVGERERTEATVKNESYINSPDGLSKDLQAIHESSKYKQDRMAALDLDTGKLKPGKEEEFIKRDFADIRKLSLARGHKEGKPPYRWVDENTVTFYFTSKDGEKLEYTHVF